MPLAVIYHLHDRMRRYCTQPLKTDPARLQLGRCCGDYIQRSNVSTQRSLLPGGVQVGNHNFASARIGKIGFDVVMARDAKPLRTKT